MITSAEALSIIREVPYRLPAETVSLAEAAGRVLAADVYSPSDDPPFDKSAMDGYALGGGTGEQGAVYQVAGTAAAGDVYSGLLGPGQAVRIMTGAKLPSGTEAVIRREYTEEKDGIMKVLTRETQSNIIKQGENFRKGHLLLSKRLLTARHAGILASVGISRIRAAARPRVGIITTGAEIREAGKETGDGLIFNSNGPMLAAMIPGDGGLPINYGIVDDDAASLNPALRKALGECNVILFTGGVSMGDFDLVPETVENAGTEVLFYKVAIRPGMPVLFGRKDNVFIFGLPGNPVSVFVTYEIFVRELLAVISGTELTPVTVSGRLSETVSRKNAEREEYRPGRCDKGIITPLSFRGSSHLHALADANCLYRFDQGTSILEKDSEIHVRLL